MKQFIIILVLSICLMSCSTNRLIVATTLTHQKVSVKLPQLAKSTTIVSLAKSGSKFAENMSTDIKQYWKGYKIGDFNLYTGWKEKGTYKDIYQEKGAFETATQGSKNVLKSEFLLVNGQTFYLSAWKDNENIVLQRAIIYFNKSAFAISIECKEKDFPKAQEMLMEIIKTVQVK